MGKILPSYTKEIIQELVDNIISNTSHYYAFGSNPVAYVNTTPSVANNDYDTAFVNDWQMLFGKKITGGDIVPVISKSVWTANNVYTMYNNISDTLNTNNDFYVVTEPSIVGGSYHVYKCIDNANGSYSTVDPSSISVPTQPTTFKTLPDGYKWRYMYSISSKNYEKFSSDDYIPVYSNATISASAINYSGVEVVQIVNSGVGYSTYHDGIVKANPNNSVIQIDNAASENNDFYVNNSIYIYNTFDSTAQITDIVNYVANGSGKFVFVNPTVNTAIITPSVSQYKISPKVKFETDGDNNPIAYSVINTTSNSIQSVVVLDIGTNISWANVEIQSNNSFGSGANLYAIVPPPGGHGSDPITELNVKGVSLAFTFANTESNTIPTSNVLYNKIGLIKNPYSLSANISTGTITKTTRYTANTFNQLLTANISPSYTFNIGESVTGNTSGARGTVVYSNTTVVYLSGDKSFIDGEYISNNSGNFVTTISINEVGDIFTKDLKPLYIENINNVNRIDDQTESYRLTIKF